MRLPVGVVCLLLSVTAVTAALPAAAQTLQETQARLRLLEQTVLELLHRNEQLENEVRLSIPAIAA